jgi:lipopolysaccharide/colanic/teichoic acid biosynthesis glycosyltransferase
MDIARQKSASKPWFLTDRPVSELAKRIFDLLVSSLGLVFLSPFFLFIAWAICRDSPGPVFYRGPRLGRHGRKFHILKFRTMFEAPESYQGPRLTAQDDPRITPFGRRLRAAKLNELPQLWNVLKGEMSLVGPRPEDPQLAGRWPEAARREVISVRPGITSPASVLYRDEEARLNGQPLMETYFKEVLPTKLRLDQLYVRNRSFWLDLDILFYTALVLIPRLGAGRWPERALFSGPFSRYLSGLLGWIAVDSFISILAFGLAGLAWSNSVSLSFDWLTLIPAALIFAILFNLSGILFNVHRVRWSLASYRDLPRLLAAGGVATGLIFILLWPLRAFLAKQSPLAWPAKYAGLIELSGMTTGLFFFAAPVSTVLLFSAVTLAWIGFAIIRYRLRLLNGLALGWFRLRGEARAVQERVLVIGSGETGQFAAWLLKHSRYARLFHVIGFTDDDRYKLGMQMNGLPVLGSRDDIDRLVSEFDVGILVFAIHNITPEDRQRLLELCHRTSARLVLMPDILAALDRSSAGRSTPGVQVFLPGQAVIQSAGAAGSSRKPDQDIDEFLAELNALAQAGDLDTIQRRLVGRS